MRSLYLRFTAILLFLSVFPAAAQQATVIYQGRQVIAKQVILRLRNNNDEHALARVAARLSGATITPLSAVLGVHVIKSDTNSVETLMAVYGADSDILYAEPNYVVHGTATPSDSQFSQLWGIRKIGALQAWDQFTGSTRAAVGIIDTGVDYTHPDLAQNVWSAPWSYSVKLGGQTIVCPAGSHGFNAIAMNCDPKDDNSHGTHVSGTIGAVGNNGVGVTGINWTTQIVGIKFLDSNGSGSLADAINGIEFALQVNSVFASSSTPVNIRVLSASWGADDFSQSLLDELNTANDRGILFVAAAGNAGSDNDHTAFYPAGYNAPNVIAVAATDSNEGLASFSNYGGGSVHLAAPGVSILSTVSGGGYAYYSGTSMATPHVAGAALLTLGACPALSVAQLKATLLGAVDNVSSLQGKTITGGRLNVNRAIQSCTAQPAAPPVAPSCLASVASDHWKGEYFNNMTLSGTPLMVRDDGAGDLNMAWGNEASPNPGCNLPGAVFSVRWTRVATFSGGMYRFNTSSDDGMRMYIDGTRVLDRWFDQGANPIVTDVPVTGGTHTVVVEYYQNRGGNSAAVSWQQLSPGAGCIAAVAADHWKGEYFNNMTLSGNALMVRDDGAGVLSFNWGNEGSSSTACNLPGRQFSARWTRAVNFAAGTYTFTTSSDDGMRVYVDGQKLVDRWYDQGANPIATNVTLSGGTHTLTVEYYQNGGGDSATVSWQIVGIAPPSAPVLSIGSVTPATVTAGTNPTLMVAGTGLESSFQAFLITGGQITEIASRAFVSNGLVKVAPVIGGVGDANARLQITVGNQTASIAVPILPPAGVTSVVITAPSTGATVSGTVTVSASANTSPGQTITSVQFRVDNGSQGASLTASPYNTVLDTTRFSNGAHSLTAVVTDSSGSTTISTAVSIVVNNAAAPSPPASSLVTAFAPRGLRNGDNGWAGMQFTVGSAPLKVSSLGRLFIAGNTRSHTVKLVNANNGTDVPGASVTVLLPGGTPGQFAYASLATPITLPANTSYFLVSEETSGGDQWYDVSSVASTNAVLVNSPVFWTGSRWYSMGIGNATYVPVSLLYQ